MGFDIPVLREFWRAGPRFAKFGKYPRSDVLFVLALSLAAAASTSLVSHTPLVADGAVQLEMARSFASAGEFQVQGRYSQFYPPLYLRALVLAGTLFGFTSAMVHAFQTAPFGFLVFSIYIVGYGLDRRAAQIAAVLVALNPVPLAEAGQGRANLSVAFAVSLCAARNS